MVLLVLRVLLLVPVEAGRVLVVAMLVVLVALMVMLAVLAVPVMQV